MQRHEKKAFLKFFITYFISIAILILAVGFFYLEQMRGHLLKSEEFSIMEHARQIKMGDSLDELTKEYKHTFLDKKDRYIDIRNFTITNNEFIKFIPMRDKNYLKVSKSKKNYDKELWQLKKKIFLTQVLLLLFFAYISYILAKSALKPLQESILTLDKFAKDLIHDLNTPVTSIKLNIKILQKDETLKQNSAISRLNRSVHTISELHENLTILLEEETFLMELIDICEVIEEVVNVLKQIYPNIKFEIKCKNFKAKLNKHALKQILQNIISNACKYNSKDGYIKIYKIKNSIYIEDSGKGIKEPGKIFERSFSAENSSGIGLDIVKRLANAMMISIEVKSSQKGSIFILTIP